MADFVARYNTWEETQAVSEASGAAMALNAPEFIFQCSTGGLH
jgi:hypothetical protein